MKSHFRLQPTALAFVLLASLLMVSVALAAEVVIDTFNVAPQTVEASNPVFIADGSASDPTILGTERDIHVQRLSGSVTRVQVGPPSNTLVFTLGPGDLGTASVIYDGADANPALDPDGLCSPGCVDLTGGGTNDSLHFEAVFNDKSFLVEFRVYSGSTTDYLRYQLILPGSIELNRHVDFMIPFADFTSVGNGASFANVGAFEIFLDGSDPASAGAKLTLDLFKADSWRDFGDAPAGYGTVTHRPNGLRLGANVDAEASQLFNPNAVGDDTNQSDDEEGVLRTPGFNWSTIGGGSVDVTLNGCMTTPCFLNGWVDWDKDGQFESGEQIFTDFTLNSNGSHTLTFTIPAGPAFNTSYFARFRVCTSAATCSSPTGFAGSGEVEDYLWAFGPTAIELSSFSAQSGSPQQYILILAIAALTLLVGASAFALVKRYQKA